LVGVFSVAVYLVVALLLIRPLGMLGLVLADSAKHFGHAMTMLYLTQRRIGGLASLRLGTTAVKALVAAGAMAGVILLGLAGTVQWLAPAGLGGKLLAVLIPGTLGILVYLGLVTLLRLKEVATVGHLLLQRLWGARLD
jgi:peptidoglycan biosynthesis protein MviN/MurJ (putative lipid II flippase)